MLFTIGNAIAEVCASQKSTLNLAQAALATAALVLVGAEYTLYLAILAGNPLGIAGALVGVGVGAAGVAAASYAVTVANEAYLDCLHRHTAEDDDDGQSTSS